MCKKGITVKIVNKSTFYINKYIIAKYSIITEIDIIEKEILNRGGLM